jgi:cytochrome P450
MHPQAWFALDEEIRRCRTHRFPFGVIYTIEQGEVLVISVMHLHRHPESWRRNLP